jgi:DNA-binding transcriptional regulator/RsmH inhibitor MraZ
MTRANNVGLPKQGERLESFFGTYECRIDRKGRLKLPENWREKLNPESPIPGKLFLTEIFNSGKSSYLELSFKRHADPRFSYEVRIDKKRRIALPEAPLQNAFGKKRSIGGVAASGCEDHIEIWRPGTREELAQEKLRKPGDDYLSVSPADTPISVLISRARRENLVPKR